MHGAMKNAHILAGTPEEKKQLGRIGLDGRIILKIILKKYDVMVWTGFIWLRVGTSGGLL
jgi:hypothetical protein